MKNTFSFLLFVLFFYPTSDIIAQNKTKDDAKKSIDSLTHEMEKKEGLLTIYRKENKLFFELQDSLLHKEFLMVTRYSQLPSFFGAYINAGSKTSEQLIQFEKKDNLILLTQRSTINIAEDGDPIQISVNKNNFPPILGAFKIENKEPNRYLIAVGKFFNSNSPGFNLIPDSAKKDNNIGGIDAKRSFIDEVNAYPKNVEITHTLTFSTSKATRTNPTKTISMQVNHSVIALPDKPMKLRYADPRVGWFSLKKYDYSSSALKSDEIKLIRRWRLEPTDSVAYAKGFLVSPKKPIVYYLDPATPLKWRPYFKKGIEDWNAAFEKAGFKNAIIAKDPPTIEEDPEFNPEDIRYSTVRYVASTTRNAIGPSVSDPRTGEILESDIIWYHNHLRSYRNRYLLETGAANPKARTLDTPEEEIGEMMRQVIAHEVGHALGLPHNMKASSAYPVDSLRSGSFTQKNGIATTLMDYARYNYVAQPGDKNIRFVRQLGPYDHYAIEWGYRYFQKMTAKEIQSKLKAFVNARSLNPIYQFGSGGNDPNSQTENIGDDPVLASDYGLKNLKIVAENLDSWTTPKGATYDDLKELYIEMISVYRRYVYHVLSIVGGVEETLILKGQGVTPYQNVKEASQKRALQFLNQYLWSAPEWLLSKSLLSKIKPANWLQRIENLQKAALYRLLSPKKLNQMLAAQETLAESGLAVEQLLSELQNAILLSKDNPDLLDRNLQKNLLNRYIELVKDSTLNVEVKGLIQSNMILLKKYFKKKKTSNTILKAHYTFCYEQLAKE